MKRLAAIATAFALSVMPTPAIAERPSGTWIETYRVFTDPQDAPNSTCAKVGLCGYTLSIDINSIVKRGDIYYFNVWLQFLHKDGNYLKIDSLASRAISGWRVNCLNETIKAPTGSWETWMHNRSSQDMGELVCNN